MAVLLFEKLSAHDQQLAFDVPYKRNQLPLIIQVAQDLTARKVHLCKTGGGLCCMYG